MNKQKKKAISFKVLRKSQSVLEYAVIIACVTGALLSMQIYIKRGIQGRLRQAADDIGEQYAPVNIDSNITTALISTTTIDSELVPLADKDGNPYLDPYGLPVYGIKTTVDLDEIVTKSGEEKLGQFESTLF